MCDIADYPVAVLAGGLASRMRPLTQSIPKSMLEVAGRPFVDHHLNLLREKGFRRVVMCVGYLSEMIVAHIGDGADYGLAVSYVNDGEKPLGTGGAIVQALPHLGQKFFVTYGDTYLDVDYRGMVSVMDGNCHLGVMALYRNNGKWDTSNATIENGLTRYSKQNPLPDAPFIDYGISLVSCELFQDFPAGQTFDLADALEAAANAGRLAAYEVHNRFYEVGSIKGLQKTEQYITARSNRPLGS